MSEKVVDLKRSKGNAPLYWNTQEPLLPSALKAHQIPTRKEMRGDCSLKVANRVIYDRRKFMNPSQLHRKRYLLKGVYHYVLILGVSFIK